MITATRVLPALDLVLAWSKTDRSAQARRLLEQIEAYLDGPDAPKLPMFTVQRARAHALAGDANLAQQTLERAYTEGFRMNCVLDLYPQPLLYVDCIDVDPAFALLQREGQFDAWLARIRRQPASAGAAAISSRSTRNLLSGADSPCWVARYRHELLAIGSAGSRRDDTRGISRRVDAGQFDAHSLAPWSRRRAGGSRRSW